MSDPLRILFVEDSPADVDLCLRELAKSGRAVESRRVGDGASLRSALGGDRFDVVISDWSLPGLSAIDALRAVRAMRPDTPFIIVSGTIGEETAVEAVREGADDYVSKDHLGRLPLALDRALREADNRARRRAAEVALRESELRFSRLWESGIIAIAISGVDGCLHEANDTYLNLVGRTRAELAGRALNWKAHSAPQGGADDRAALEDLHTLGRSQLRQKELVLPDGSSKPVLIGAATLSVDRLIAFLVDLSEQKRAEAALRRSQEELVQAQKMEAIGRLAGGIAHDFNNLLSVILGYAGLALAEYDGSEAARDDLLAIEEAGRRAADLTRQLLAFSRRQVLAPRVVDLDEVVLGMVGMLRRLIGADIQLVTDLAARSRIRVDPTQLEQVVMNLVVNARDAMPDGGSVSLSSTVVELEPGDATEALGLAPGRYVRLDVADTGVGMDAATRARVFEPFFTTKELGKGTGLGLATVHGIVRQSGGAIASASDLGKGSRFSIYLPRVEAALDASAVSPPNRLAGTETILLVEDEAQVRAMTRAALKRLGYKVLEARAAGDALMISDDESIVFDLVLTDVVMPGMNGVELAHRIVAARPASRVLLMSGYLDDGHARLDASRFPFIQKPITPEILAVRVRAALDDDAPSGR